jgi:hypothetical protein
LKQRKLSIRNGPKETAKISGLIDEFTLGTFDQWVDKMRKTEHLAPEVTLALDQFLETLNKFLDNMEDIDDEDIHSTTPIKWYTMCILPNGEYIRAKSQHYNMPFFDNVAINMTNDKNEELPFFTANGICFGKVSI